MLNGVIRNYFCRRQGQCSFYLLHRLFLRVIEVGLGVIVLQNFILPYSASLIIQEYSPKVFQGAEVPDLEDRSGFTLESRNLIT